MVGDLSLIQFDGAGAVTRSLTNSGASEAYHLQTGGSASTETIEFIALVESRTFIRECIRRSLQSALPFQIVTCSDASELQRVVQQPPKLILLSAFDNNEAASENVFKLLSAVAPGIPVVVLAYKADTRMASSAIYHGVRGYIPVTSDFEITIEAVRFVLAGGTYAPLDYILARTWAQDHPSDPATQHGPITARELAVVRAIQLGKSNKVIAYELGMCEGTVKVHVRRIMKKLKARNRTEVAIKSRELLRCSNCEMKRECWSTGHCARLSTS